MHIRNFIQQIHETYKNSNTIRHFVSNVIQPFVKLLFSKLSLESVCLLCWVQTLTNKKADVK